MEKNLFAILRTKERLHQIIIKFLLQIKFDLPFLLLLKSRFPILIFLLFVDYSYKPKKSLYFLLFFCFYLFWLYKSLVQIFFVFVSKFYRGLRFWGKILGDFVVLGIFEFAFWGIVRVPSYLKTHILHIMIYIAIVKMIFEKMLRNILPQGNRLILVKFFGCYENLSCILLLSDSNLLDKVCSFDDRNYLGNFLFWKLLLVPNMVLSFIFYK